MKCLTIRQPHVAAIFAGLKPFETRTWSTNYRGPLAIHAAVNLDRDKLFDWMNGVWPDWAERLMRKGFDARSTAIGAVVGTVELVSCVPVEIIPRSARDWGDFSPGRWAWRLRDHHLLDEPVLARGRLGLWNWDVALP